MKRPLVITAAVLLQLPACGPAPRENEVDLPSESGIDPAQWATVPQGPYPSGQHEEWVDLDYDYQIMITNVTNQRYAEYLNLALADGSLQLGEVEVHEGGEIHLVQGLSGDYPGDPFHGYEHEERILPGQKLHFSLEEADPRILFNGNTFSSVPEYASHPVTMVTWFGAQAYCQYFGWKLPLEQEWEKAARGREVDGEYALPFPWGEEIDSSYANYYSSYDLFEKILRKLGGTTPVGFYNGRTYQGFSTSDHASPYGLYDMAGNVWQWTGDDYPNQHYRYLRGGSYFSYEVDLRVWKRNSAAPTYYAPDVGFRCARRGNWLEESPPP